jgi:hypothetical protein
VVAISGGDADATCIVTCDDIDIVVVVLLSREFHILYDNYLWVINHQTLQVELVKDEPDIIGTIYKYNGKKVNLKPNF